MGNDDFFPGSPEHGLELRRAEQLQAYIEALEAGQSPAPPADLSPSEADAFALIALFRAATPDAVTPDPDFIANLGDRLIASLSDPSGAPQQAEPIVPLAPPIVAIQPAPATHAPSRARPSRRTLLAGGLSAAAGIAAGLVGGTAIERAIDSVPGWNVPIVGNGGVWMTVAQVSALAPGAVARFATAQIAGHLIRRSDGTFVAFSAACTHMGCILAWNATERSFDCPCHNGRFNDDGSVRVGSTSYRPLPALATRVTGTDVQVFVPLPADNTASGQDPLPGAPTPTSEPYSH